MTLLNLFAIISFAFVTSVTPGPNNLMLLASGANFGFRRTLPHMFRHLRRHGLVAGLCAGRPGRTVQNRSPLQLALRIGGVGYLLWLSWKILRTPPRSLQAGDDRARPFAWWQAVLFQFVNPKAWLMAITAVSSFTLAGQDYLGIGQRVDHGVCRGQFAVGSRSGPVLAR